MNYVKVNHLKLVEFTHFFQQNIFRKTDWYQRWIKNSFFLLATLKTPDVNKQKHHCGDQCVF